jgi:hypothetical protein
MIEEIFEKIEQDVAKKFQVKYLNPKNGDGATYDIALEYVKFIIEEYNELLYYYARGYRDEE